MDETVWLIIGWEGSCSFLSFAHCRGREIFFGITMIDRIGNVPNDPMIHWVKGEREEGKREVCGIFPVWGGDLILT